MTNQLKSICLLSLGSLALPVQSLVAADSSEKMNVLFLLVDDLRWNSLNCMGTDFLITPNIDKLAEDGVLFNNAYVTTGISCVSRASIFTGQYMSRHGIKGFFTPFTDEQFANSYLGVMRDNGYWTGVVGKYGVGVKSIKEEDFDYARIYEGIHWYPVDEDAPIEKFKNGYTRIGQDSIHVTDRNRRDALDFLATRPDDKPFVLSLGFYATHAEDLHPEQYRPKPESEVYYKDIEIPTSFKADDEYLERMPHFLQSDLYEGRKRYYKRFDTPEKYQTMMKNYFRLLTEVDEVVGDLVAELKRTGDYDNTLIVFMGDNGYFHSERQIADKWLPYEESIRVPLIIYDPRVKNRHRGSECNDIALNIDLAPTILRAAGLDIPEVMQGEDLAPIYIDRDSKGWRTEFFYEHAILGTAARIPSSQGLVSLERKYIKWPDFDMEEYFDLSTDPEEVVNQINNESYQESIEQAKIRLQELSELAK